MRSPAGRATAVCAGPSGRLQTAPLSYKLYGVKNTACGRDSFRCQGQHHRDVRAFGRNINDASLDNSDEASPGLQVSAQTEGTVPRWLSESMPQQPGLKSTPMGSGVQNATSRFLLPEPTLAVRNLIEGAQYAHLCTNMSHMHHRRAGYPFGMLVDFAADGLGFPIFCLSPLSIHSHNIHEDPRCSLVVQMPGWTGLSNARVTIFGDVYELSPEKQEVAKQIFRGKHNNGERLFSSNFRFYSMARILDIYFVGGFGTVQWINVEDYATTVPDAIVMYHPHETIEALTKEFGCQLSEFFANSEDGMAGDAAVIAIDAVGLDVRIRHSFDCTVHRLSFDTQVCTPEDARRAVRARLGQPLTA